MSSTSPLPAWAEGAAWQDLPVLRATARAVREQALRPDDADAHALAALVLRDPLMCLRVLASAVRRQSGAGTPVESITAALVLTGVDPFFRDCAALPVLEDRLDRPSRLRVLAAVARSHLAARIAAAFAIHRQVEAVEEVRLAALLHDFVAVLAPWFDPQAAPDAPGSAGMTDALLLQWGLPDTLRTLAREPAGEAPGPRMVALAVRIARHMQHGWHGPVLLGDAAQAGQLLNLTPQAAASLVRQAAG